MNKTIRECNKCNYSANSNEFPYRGDSVWNCPECGSMYTHVKDVIDLDEDRGDHQ